MCGRQSCKHEVGDVGGDGGPEGGALAVLMMVVGRNLGVLLVSNSVMTLE